ncbi:MAG: sulfatase [Verrucomicrobiales bacterium]|nr:sulfatase [Verrucomicrobiales bacterium]
MTSSLQPTSATRPWPLPFVFLVGLMLPWFSPDAQSAASAPRPNIVFIMSDDHAAHAISAYGSTVNQTPHLDRLGAQGLRLDRCFAVNSICTPSRATILTGQYSHRNGNPVFNHLDPAKVTVAHRLRDAGYYTAMIGKWHLGSDPQGFDYWNILPGQGRYQNPILYDRDGHRVYKGYVTDVVTDLAIAAIEQRPKDKPFFVMCHHKAPHRDWSPNDKYRAEFSRRVIPEPTTLRDDYATRADALREQKQSVFADLTRNDLKLVPPSELDGAERQRWLGEKPTEVEIEQDGRKVTLRGDALERWKYQRYMQDYLGCVQSVDDNVGRLMDWLDAHGLKENTLVIYTSDQGFFLGDHGLYDKRFMYEPSIKMPFLARWPAGIKPGTVSDALAINCDFAPTFLELAGAPIPADMQGRSLWPLFAGQRPADWRDAFYYRYYHDPGHHDTRAHLGIRTDTHKLIHYWKKDQWECFDLRRDPDELKNIANDPDQKTVVDALKQRLAQLKREVGDTDQFSQELPKDDVDQPPPQLKRKHADSPL